MKTDRQRARGLRTTALMLVAGCMMWAASDVAGAGGTTSVRCRENATVASNQVLLGDVAEVDGRDAEFVRRLEALVLARAPLPGKTRELDRATLLGRIRQSGVDPALLDLQLPAEIVVTRAAMTVGGDQIESAVRDYVQQQLGGAGDNLRIKDVYIGESVLLPQGQLTIRVVGPKNIDWIGLVPVNVFLRVEGETEKRVSATVRIERLIQVVVARRPLGRYKPIDDDDIELKSLDAAGLPAECIVRPETVIGKRTRRPLDAGSVLTQDVVEFPPLVKYGDRVRIIAETSGLRISAFGQVKQKGAQGELIQVVNLDSNRVIHARVVDSHTVKIDF